MKIPKNIRILRNPLAPKVSAFTHPEQPSGGAMEFAPAMTMAYPLVPVYGGGVIVSDMPQIDTGPPLRSKQTVLAAPLAGSGIPAGQLELDNPLQDDESNFEMDTSAAEYDE